METITIPASALPARGHLVRDTLLGGHAPGVLSLANLKGKAKSYAGTYMTARARALQIAAAHGVTDDYVLINSRKARVWVRAGTATPVSIVIAEG